METKRDLTFKDQKIVNIGMEHELKQSFIEYSMSVITSRALPDVRDGMKPGQRRILWAMYEDHLTHDKPFRTSATTVGIVLGRYHPHGDAAVYGTMVRMAQDFSLRCPLIEGSGNFGSIDGDGAAAYRYTEARLSRISDEMLRDIDKEVVPMMRNFDNKLVEPTVLPSRFPNLLVNGTVGIAVGMATNIPPHNLGEVIDATLYRMDNPECTVNDLMQYIKGPDFPTSAIIYGVNGIREAYLTGKGRIMVRARANIEEEKHRIVVTEIPYGVNKSLLCESIASLVKEKRVEGITELRDESGRNGMKIIIGYRRDANAQVILNQLYKYTQLQDTCAVNMLALVDGEPKILPLTAILDAYIAHQESIIINRTKFDLEKARQRAHIFEGYKIAIDNIDEIVAIMKSSPSIPESKTRLIERYSLSDAQAQAIVDMTLGRLTGMEREKVEAELTRIYGVIKELEGILGDMGRVKQIIHDEMNEIKDRYSDPRRTEIVEASDDIVLEDLIEKHDCVITISHTGYIKRQPADTYTAQRRGGKRRADGGVGNRERASHVRKAAQQLDRSGGKLQHLHRGRGGGTKIRLQRLRPGGVVLRYGIRFSERRERRGVFFHARKQRFPQLLRLTKQLAQNRLGGGVLLFPDRQLPHHAAERGGKSAGKGACAAAAGYGRSGRERSGKFVHAFMEHFHF